MNLISRDAPRTYPLGEILSDAKSGFASGETAEDGIVQVRMNNVTQNGMLNWTKVRRVPRPENFHDSLLARPSDILFNATNSPDLVGKSALFTGFGEPVTFSNHFIRLRVNSARADSGYVSRWLQRCWQSGIFSGMCKQWVNQASISRDQLSALEVPLPSLDEQQRIAAILDQADDLRRKRQAALAKANALVRALFASMIGDVNRNERGWSRKCLSDLCEVRTGNTPSRQDSRYYGSHLEWIKSDNLDEDKLFVTTASEQLSELGVEVGRTAPRGATLVTCIAGSPTSIGNAGFLDREVAFNQQINALIPKSINARFLFEHVRNAKPLIQEKSTGGMKGLVSKSRLESIKFMVPPIEVQTSFAQLVENVIAMKSMHSEQLSKLDALFASLQHRAFRGEL